MSNTKYFFDTEFIEDGRSIDLISMGLVCEDGRSLYVQNAECDFKKASDWVWRNVFPHLLHFDMRGFRACDIRVETTDSGLRCRTFTTCDNKLDTPCPWSTRNEIRDRILEFCPVDKYGEPEFWGYFADYDWVVFCQLFGTMAQLPKGFPMYCRDIKQWADQLGNIRIPKAQEVEIHQALVDAVWIKSAYEFLTKQV